MRETNVYNDLGSADQIKQFRRTKGIECHVSIENRSKIRTFFIYDNMTAVLAMNLIVKICHRIVFVRYMKLCVMLWLSEYFSGPNYCYDGF